VPNTAVFCSSLISRFPGFCSGYCLNDFEMAPVAPIIIIIIIIINDRQPITQTNSAARLVG